MNDFNVTMTERIMIDIDRFLLGVFEASFVRPLVGCYDIPDLLRFI